MVALKIIQIGDSLGLILPEEIRARLKLGEGQLVLATDTPHGIAITPCGPAAEQLALGGEFLRENKETFRELAK